MKVSAVLITRENAWPTDAQAHLDAFGFDEVLLETRCPGVHRRFELARQARHDVVYVQDDDCTLDIFRLWTSALPHQLTYGITPDQKAVYDGLCGSRVCLIGWGAFFPRAWADPARWQPFIDRVGPVPSHEADRVFSYFAEPKVPVLLQVQQLQRRHAMSRDNGSHYESRAQIIAQLMSLAA